MAPEPQFALFCLLVSQHTFRSVLCEDGESGHPVGDAVAEAGAVGCHVGIVGMVHVELKRRLCKRAQPLAQRITVEDLLGFCTCRLTWDVRPIVLDVHFMQAGLSGGVLHGDGPIQIVCNGGLG